jgi:hypothetical protein
MFIDFGCTISWKVRTYPFHSPDDVEIGETNDEHRNNKSHGK